MKLIIYIIVVCLGFLTTCIGADTYGVLANSSITTSEGTEHITSKSTITIYTPEDVEERRKAQREYVKRLNEARESHAQYLKRHGHGHSGDPIVNPYLEPKTPAELKTEKALLDKKVMQFRLEKATNGSVMYQLKVSNCYSNATDGFPKDDSLAKYWYQKSQHTK